MLRVVTTSAGALLAATGAAPSSKGFPWAALAVSISSAFIGSLLAFGFALWLARRERVARTTLEMVNQFSSREMLQSRFVTTGVATQVRDGRVSIRDVALSTVQDCPVGFVGITVDGLTEHQHISNVIGWLRRLAVHVRNGWVDQGVVAGALGGSLQWTLPFLLEVAAEAEHVMNDYPSTQAPEFRASWAYAVRYLDIQLYGPDVRSHMPGVN